jgi:prepilin-type N-terminal cleavage/methylation domain-containing protein
MRTRRGVTLVEIAIVVAIIGILAAVGAGMMSDLMPSWRTRRAAREFAAQASQARAMAMSDSVQYRVYIEETDPDPATSSTNHGIYWVQRGDLPSHTTEWDTLPVEMTGSDDLQGEGYVNIQKDAEDSLPWVSIEALPDVLAGEDSWTDSIIFNPRGMLDNPATDFTCDINGDGSSDGYICVTFVNQKAALSGREDEWTVLISRAGSVRLQHGQDAAVGYTSGSQVTSQGGSSGDGYAGGSSGSSDPS